MNASRFFILAIALGAAACRVNQEHYRTAAEARAAGAAQRGMLPAFVPDTATNVHMVIDHDSGRVWVWCDLDPLARSELKAKVTQVGWGQAAANTKAPPFGFSFPPWNPILGGTLTYTPPAASLYFVSDAWHGIADADGKCWMTLTSASKPRSLPRHMQRIPQLMGRMVMRRPGADA